MPFFSLLASGPSLSSTPPPLPSTIRAGAPVSAPDRQALTRWVLAQGPVARTLAGHRHRVLGAGTDAEGEGGSERALLYVRDYDAGATYEIAVDLAGMKVALRPLQGLIQPSREEIEEA